MYRALGALDHELDRVLSAGDGPAAEVAVQADTMELERRGKRSSTCGKAPPPSEANPEGADLSGANLEGAQLQGSRLSNADLRGANLRFADLTDAIAIQAITEGAQVEGLEFSGAELYRSNLIVGGDDNQ